MSRDRERGNDGEPLNTTTEPPHLATSDTDARSRGLPKSNQALFEPLGRDTQSQDQPEQKATLAPSESEAAATDSSTGLRTGAQNTNKRSIFQFTYTSENFLLELIYKHREDLFTRGNTIKTWELVLNAFNEHFRSSIIQTRTINNRFKALRSNLEKKLHNDAGSSLNENENLLVQLNEYLGKKKHGIKDTGDRARHAGQLLLPKYATMQKMHVPPQPTATSYKHKLEEEEASRKRPMYQIPMQMLPPGLVVPPAQPTAQLRPTAPPVPPPVAIPPGIAQPPPGIYEGRPMYRPEAVPEHYITRGATPYKVGGEGERLERDLLERILATQSESNAMIMELHKEVKEFRREVDYRLTSFINYMNYHNEGVDAKLDKMRKDQK